MAEVRLNFEESKYIIKCYRKHENIMEVQRQLRENFHKEPETYFVYENQTKVCISSIKSVQEYHGH